MPIGFILEPQDFENRQFSAESPHLVTLSHSHRGLSTSSYKTRHILSAVSRSELVPRFFDAYCITEHDRVHEWSDRALWWRLRVACKDLWDNLCISHFSDILRVFLRNTSRNMKHPLYTFHVSFQFRVKTTKSFWHFARMPPLAWNVKCKKVTQNTPLYTFCFSHFASTSRYFTKSV